MRTGARIASAIELLEMLHSNWNDGHRAPADGVLSDYFKARRFMGSKDRGFVSELVYFILRHGGAIEWWLDKAKADSKPRQIVIAALILGFDFTRGKLAELFDGKHFSPKPLSAPEKDLADTLSGQALIDDDMPDWAKFNVPVWLEKKLKASFGEDYIAEIDAMNKEAPIDLRVNTLKCPDRGDLIMELDRLNYYGIPTPHSPIGVRLKKRLPVFTLDLFKNGWFEMQDEGSQMVAQIINAQPGEKVIDFCAGAGGKTLAIAAKMENKGRLLAWDVNEKRLNQIKKRLARAGVDNVLLHVLESTTDPFIKRHKDSADWVLVDAPCSGSGTWRRNPDLKWRLTPEDLTEVKALQHDILRSAARTVKSGGRLIYATCSLFDEENQTQAKSFLVDHPEFTVEPLPQIWNKLIHRHEGLGECLRLTPYNHGTDGFFAIMFKRL